MLWIITRFCKRTRLIVGFLLVSGFWILNGCSGDNSTGPDTSQVADITISPDEAAMESGEQIDFSVFALTESGDTVNTDEIDIEWQWWSTDPDVFDVEPGGLATALNSGEAYCVVEATVSVSQRITDEMDIYYAGIVFNGKVDHEANKKSMTLLPEEPERFENVKTAFKKKLRFVGRDSAFVFVF